ncbi:BZ3500_MvSof-1268-A1-R1_Chr11-1g03311 [Microbotryum saponariae]|uniref:DNA 3'-5' helicase n=1 Tax=Microbotryum saponariae TaxID=289078 RepID=A0A2X0NFM6_9BASI|nr:BZ3501_MvSof-1269-A2-R1_Chr11g02887 [Microbotryum saponariae]SDA03937.1 BZ3500_MvSof-1268-A1-R1_Chr11-1g03311 [Microbotryum saponariae]
MDRDSLRIKVKLLLLEKFGDDFEPRPFQINAIAGLLELDRKRGCTNTFDAVFVAAPTGSGKSTLFEAMSLVFGKRAITIIISPLNALSEHQAAKLCMRGKMAVVVSKKTWEDGKLYEQLKDRLCEVEYIFISPEMNARNVRWSELIFTSSFRERIKLLVYNEAIKIAEWGLTGRKDRVGAMAHTTEGSNPFRAEYAQIVQQRLRIGCQTLFLTAGAPPDKIDKILAVATISKSRTFFAKADLFRPNLRNIVVEMTPHTKATMTDIPRMFSVRSNSSSIPQSIVYCNTREETSIGLSALHKSWGLEVTVDSPLARQKRGFQVFRVTLAEKLSSARLRRMPRRKNRYDVAWRCSDDCKRTRVAPSECVKAAKSEV